MIGRTISHYRVTDKLGEGGMGEVYRARDDRLNRDVALKVLRPAFAQDADRMARFQREAQVLASLNHPNIAAIHGLEDADGVRALVLELVEGRTLADQIRSGPVPPEEALPIARQIAEALEYAHERGIIHRDLKPANVKITPEGTAKVLDFGLAKAFELEAAATDPLQSPTVSELATRPGVILGTAAYMSPEQARGRAVDKRADTWAFGVMLFEMLSGQNAFASETVSDTLAAVLKTEVDWSALPAATPATLRWLLRRCLEKDPKQRLRDIGEARILLEKLQAGVEEPAPLPGPAPQLAWRRALPWALVPVALALALGALWAYDRVRRESTATAEVRRLVMSLPQESPLVSRWPGPGLALSPDGRNLVYVSPFDNTTRLLRRSLSDFEVKPLPGTENAASPFFSPDGEWIGFFVDGKMKKVPLTGGGPVTLCNATDPAGVSWAPDGAIYFVPAWVSGLLRVPAAGGTPETVVNPDPDQGERGFLWPQVLPGGEAVLLTVYRGGNIFEDSHILAYSLKTGERHVLVKGGGFGRYVPTGHLLYVSGKSIHAVEFSAARLEVRSAPKPVLDGISINTATGIADLAFAGDGTLAYVSGTRRLPQRSLVWVDRQGREQPLPAPLHPYEWPRLSPDGRRVAVTIEGDAYDVWLYHLERNILSRLTFGEDDGRAVWFPDGRSIAFDSSRAGPNNIFRIAADGSGTVEQLTRERTMAATSISPDGRFLVYGRRDAATSWDIWVLPLGNGSPPRPFLQTPFAEGGAVFSPDGNWLAYSSDETGRDEVYVRSFPGPGAKIQVSTTGGDDPRWARNGRQLFYRSGKSWMAVDVTLAPSFLAGAPKQLFEGPYANTYDVSPDARRLLMVKAEEQGPVRELRVVLNWFAELRRLVPTANH